MNSTILNKRTKWLPELESKDLDKWTKEADKLNDSRLYFGIKGGYGQPYQKDDLNTQGYFKKSLALFKKAVELQKVGKEQDLPKLEICEKYDALITIVGFSPEPLLHTILSLAPSSVYPIATAESAKEYGVTNIAHNSKLQYFETIVDLYKDPSQTIVVKPIKRAVASIGSIDTFKRVREIIAEIKKENESARIALDITGGKKSADASAFLTVAIEKDIDIFYVDFEEYANGKPLCGTEFLNKLENPYDLYNIDLIEQAKELFRNHNYPAAVSIFTKVEENLKKKSDAFGLQAELTAIEKMHTTAKFYAAWDAFEYGDADKIQETPLLKELTLPKIARKIYEVSNQFEYVKKIALDRFANAERREAQGRYEDAITRYAQVVEIACKSLMFKIISENNLKFKIISENNLKPTLNKKECEITLQKLELDRLEISRIFDWLIKEQKELRKNTNGCEYVYAPIENKSLRESFKDIFLPGKSLSNSAVDREKEKVEIRNNFIHVSMLSAKENKMKELKTFVCKMLEVIYGKVDFAPYTFPEELD
jgi:CRISPR-associated protein (Cas_Cas02710)